MTTKQLAYVLTKILGLSIFVNGILGIAGELLNLFEVRNDVSLPFALVMPIHGIIPMAIGFCMIVKSRHIADYLFKNDDE